MRETKEAYDIRKNIEKNNERKKNKIDNRFMRNLYRMSLEEISKRADNAYEEREARKAYEKSKKQKHKAKV
jgi:hypothetical protein